MLVAVLLAALLVVLLRGLSARTSSEILATVLVDIVFLGTAFSGTADCVPCLLVCKEGT